MLLSMFAEKQKQNQFLDLSVPKLICCLWTTWARKYPEHIACVAWRFWLGALSNKGGRGQRNREEIGAEAIWFLFFSRLRRSFSRASRANFAATPLLRPARQNRHATQATEHNAIWFEVTWPEVYYRYCRIQTGTSPGNNVRDLCGAKQNGRFTIFKMASGLDLGVKEL